MKNGNIDKGLETVNKAIKFGEKSDDQLYLSEIYRLKGELINVKNGNSSLSEVENLIEKSLQIAKKQKAKSFELRTSLSIANLWKAKGKLSDGKKLVANVYKWFKEGHETRDLLEAKNLIDSISAKVSSS